jgi:hypothetical protein
MHEYIVELQEFYDGEYLDRIVFECMADDGDHAYEQASDAYPDCLICDVTRKLHLDVIAELQRDLADGDLSAIVELLENIPDRKLQEYLPQD